MSGDVAKRTPALLHRPQCRRLLAGGAGAVWLGLAHLSIFPLSLCLKLCNPLALALDLRVEIRDQGEKGERVHVIAS